jgi:hypothetical protein
MEDNSSATSQEMTGFIINEPSNAPPVKIEFDIRALENSYDPDTIIVAKGSQVTLNIVNDVDKLENEETRLRMFSIAGYAAEEATRDSGVMTIKFVADKAGEFEFGDQSRNELKGLLIVN